MTRSAKKMHFNLYDAADNLFKYPMGQKLQDDNSSNDPNLDANTKRDEVCYNTLLNNISANKDKDSFIQLFEYFAPRVKSFLMKGGLTPEMADELSQETMLAVWNKAEQFDKSQASASTWIYTIARNKKIDFFRKNARRNITQHDLAFSPSEIESADDMVNFDDQQTKIKQTLKEIPQEQADLIFKAYFEDKTHKDISEETGIPLGTVKSRIRLGLERMRYFLDGVEL